MKAIKIGFLTSLFFSVISYRVEADAAVSSKPARSGAVASSASASGKRVPAEQAAGRCGLSGSQYADLFKKSEKESGNHLALGAVDEIVAIFSSKLERIFNMGNCAKIGAVIGILKQYKNIGQVAEAGVFSKAQVDYFDKMYSIVSSLKDVCDSDMDANTAVTTGVRKYGWSEMYINDMINKIAILNRDNAEAVAGLSNISACVVSEPAYSNFVADMRTNQIPYRFASLKSAIARDKIKNKASGAREFFSTCMEIHRSDTLINFLGQIEKEKGSDYVGVPKLNEISRRLVSMASICDDALTKMGAKFDDAMLDRDLAVLNKLTATR